MNEQEFIGNPEPQAANTVQGQATLSVLLDQKEVAANRAHRLHVIGCRICSDADEDCDLGKTLNNARVLVKVLRLALEQLEHAQTLKWLVTTEEVKFKIAAILTQTK